MTKAETVFEKIAEKEKEFNWKRLLAGTIGGAVGGIATAPLATVSTLAKGQGGPTIGEAVKIINQEARNMPSTTKAHKALNYIKRYYRGTIPKVLSIGPATGIAWAVANNLDEVWNKK